MKRKTRLLALLLAAALCVASLTPAVFAGDGMFEGMITEPDRDEIPDRPGPIARITIRQPPNQESIEVRWSVSERAEKYRLQRDNGSGFWFDMAQTIPQSQELDENGDHWFDDTSARMGVRYRYRVEAINEGGYSEWVVSDYLTVGSGGSVIPGKVGTFTATAAPGSVSLSWTAAENAATYTLQHKTGGVWTDIATGLTGLSYTDSGLTFGESYVYRVWGENEDEIGAWTETDPVRVPYPQPGDVGSVIVKAAAGKITVKWTASDYAGSYTVQRKVGADKWKTVALTTGLKELTYTDTAVTGGMTYQYRVRGENPDGRGKYQTGPAVVALAPLPGSIASVSASAAADGITVSWAAADNAATYLIQRRQKGEEWGTWTTLKANLAGTSFKDTAVTPKALYQYRVRGRNEAGNGPFKTGGSVRAAALPKPGAISSVTAKAANGVTVTWTASANAKTYLLQRQVYGATTWTTVKNGLTARNYTDTAVKAGTKVRYRVRGVNDSGTGAFKVSSYVQAAAAKPGAISSVTAAATAGKISLKWTASAGASTYLVQRRAYQNGAWSGWTTVVSANRTLFCADAKVTKGVKYQYRVRGANASGSGSFKTCSAVTAK